MIAQAQLTIQRLLLRQRPSIAGRKWLPREPLILAHAQPKTLHISWRMVSNTPKALELEISTSIRRAPLRPVIASKAVLTLTQAAVARLRLLTLDTDAPKLLKIGTKNKGCSGQVYTLEYVTEKARFDEVIDQDGVKVLIDSKALFSLIGSEMDYVEDKLSAQFVFNNPNVKEMCGCGQSFMT